MSVLHGAAILPGARLSKEEPTRKQLSPWPFNRLELDSGRGTKMFAFALSKFHSTCTDDWNPKPIKNQVQSGTPGLSIPDSNKSNLRREERDLLL